MPDFKKIDGRELFSKYKEECTPSILAQKIYDEVFQGHNEATLREIPPPKYDQVMVFKYIKKHPVPEYTLKKTPEENCEDILEWKKEFETYLTPNVTARYFAMTKDYDESVNNPKDYMRLASKFIMELYNRILRLSELGKIKSVAPTYLDVLDMTIAIPLPKFNKDNSRELLTKWKEKIIAEGSKRYIPNEERIFT